MIRPGLSSRAVSAAVAVGLGVALGLAAVLEPSPAGHGTHTQLGLDGCTFLQLTGRPCPMCGATTSWSLFAHFAPLQAFLNQPFAALLFVMTVGAFGTAVAEVVDPRQRWRMIARWLEPREGWLAGGFLALMGLGWIYKLAVT